METMNIRYDELAALEEEAEFIAEYTSEETELLEKLSEETYIYEQEYEALLTDLNAVIESLAPETNSFEVYGTRMGWRNLDGYKKFTAETGEEFLRELFSGLGEFTMKGTVHFNEKKLELTVSHHDSPTGEFWIIVPCNYSCAYCGETFTNTEELQEDEDGDYICEDCSY